jgi:hypothetical protein
MPKFSHQNEDTATDVRQPGNTPLQRSHYMQGNNRDLVSAGDSGGIGLWCSFSASSGAGGPAPLGAFMLTFMRAPLPVGDFTVWGYMCEQSGKRTGEFFSTGGSSLVYNLPWNNVLFVLAEETLLPDGSKLG